MLNGVSGNWGFCVCVWVYLVGFMCAGFCLPFLMFCVVYAVDVCHPNYACWVCIACFSC